MRRPISPSDATTYREALSQWQLAARTEVKRSSSLPTAMFEAYDPLLEIRLADSVQTMMQCLHQPHARPQATDSGCYRVGTERVLPQELARLPLLLGSHHGDIDVDDGLPEEFLNVLVELSTRGGETIHRAAQSLLERDFVGSNELELDGAARQLLAQLEATLAAIDDPQQQQKLGEVSNRIAAIVFLLGRGRSESA